MNFYVYHSPCTSFITTHAPYGDEPSAMEAPLKAVSFQPTPPHGDEHQQYLFKKKRMEITTHTPVWG